mmetsp:Transcript_42174/g.109367  ORF Transcript_42174/g.109367 Transcript_42174/m.109367 type:complete len:264 (-) Transcript_42174:1570-2361(-)
MRVIVGVAQLVGQAVEEQVAPLGVQLRHEALEDVRCGGGHGRRGGALVAAGALERSHAEVEHQRVHERHVVARAAHHRVLLAEQQPLAQLERKRRGAARLEEGVHLRREQLGQQVLGVGQRARRLVDLREQVHLEVGREGVRQAHVAREGAQDEVAHLDAAGRDDVAQRKVVLAQKLRKVVQQHQQHAQRAAVQQPHGIAQLRVAQVRLQEAQQRHHQPLEVQAALGLRRQQQLGHELPVADQLQPGKGKARHTQWLQRVQRR